MKAKIINITNDQKEILRQIKREVSEVKSNLCKVPGIVFLVFRGHSENWRDSVSIHEKLAKDLGFKTKIAFLPNKTSDNNLSKIIEEYSKQPEIHSVAILEPIPDSLTPGSLTGIFRNALSEFKNAIAKEIERTRRQLNPFSLIKNYNLIRKGLALRHGF